MKSEELNIKIEFVVEYFRDGDLHRMEFDTWDEMNEFVEELKYFKPRKLRKFLRINDNEWYLLK